MLLVNLRPPNCSLHLLWRDWEEGWMESDYCPRPEAVEEERKCSMGNALGRDASRWLAASWTGNSPSRMSSRHLGTLEVVDDDLTAIAASHLSAPSGRSPAGRIFWERREERVRVGRLVFFLLNEKNQRWKVILDEHLVFISVGCDGSPFTSM
jgi:hypothetical protein